MIDEQIEVPENIEKDIPREISDNNFESVKDRLSSSSLHFEADSIILSGKEFTLKNCSFTDAQFTDCKIKFINNVEIKTLTIKSEDINTQFYGFSPDFGKITLEKLDVCGVSIKNGKFRDVMVRKALRFDDCHFITDKDSNSEKEEEYGLRIFRCNVGTLILANCTGRMLIADSKVEQGINCDNCELEKVSILRSFGGEISFKPTQPTHFRFIQSSFIGRNSTVVLSAEEAEKYYPNILEHVPGNTPLTNKKIPKLRLTAESRDRVQLSNCYIEELEFENDAEILSKISITDSVIGKIINLPRVFSQLVDFTGSTFLCDLTISNVQFEDALLMRECNFKGRVLFYKILCKDNLFLSNSVFEKKCKIYIVEINELLQAKNSIFTCETNFEYIRKTKAVVLTGAVFEKKFVFRRNGIREWMTAGDCTFKDVVEIRETDCKNLHINNSRFENSFSVIECKISDLVRIRNSEFNNNLLIQESGFNKFVLFNITFSENSEVKIWYNRFSEFICSKITFPLLNFSDNSISVNALFGADDSKFGSSRIASKFTQICSFENTRFRGKTLFNQCVFEKTAYFFNTQFEGETHFDEAQFGGDADFRTGFSQNHLTFEKTRFNGTLNLNGFFSDKRISIGTADLRDNTSSLSLTGAAIDSIDFSKQQLLEMNPKYKFWKNIYLLPFWPCLFNHEKKRTKLFNHALLREYRKADHRFNTDNLNELCNFSDPLEATKEGFERRHDQFKDMFEKKDKSQPGKAKIAEFLVDDYLSLKEAFGKSGKSHDQDWAYFRMMHYKTLAELYNIFDNMQDSGIKKTFLKYFQLIPAFFKLFFFEYLFGWGVKLWAIFRTSVLFIIFFAVLFFLVGTNTSIELDSRIISPDQQNWGIMFYLSVQAFFSVLLGDYNPQSLGPLKELVIAESIIGIFVMTFLVGAYTRKILRD